MDRNLGALNVMGNGFTYQYGRQIPFTTGKIYTYNQIKAEFVSGSFVSRNSPETLAFAISNPLTFITIGGNWDKINAYWENIWFNPDWATPSGAKGYKSFFDPCPDGWNTPEPATFAGILSSAAFNSISLAMTLSRCGNNSLGELFDMPYVSNRNPNTSWGAHCYNYNKAQSSTSRYSFGWTSGGTIYQNYSSLWGCLAVDGATRCIQE